MNQLTPEAALANLAIYTEPANATKMSRQDYVNAHASLTVLDAALKELAELKKPKAEPEDKPETKAEK